MQSRDINMLYLICYIYNGLNKDILYYIVDSSSNKRVIKTKE